MTEKKVSDIRKNEEIFISWLDDSGTNISGFAILLELSETFVKFKSHKNIIVIPISRLIKIKQREAENEA